MFQFFFLGSRAAFGIPLAVFPFSCIPETSSIIYSWLSLPYNAPSLLMCMFGVIYSVYLIHAYISEILKTGACALLFGFCFVVA